MEEGGAGGMAAKRGERGGGQVLRVQWGLGRSVDAAIMPGGEESANEEDGLNLATPEFATGIDVQNAHGFTVADS